MFSVCSCLSQKHYHPVLASLISVNYTNEVIGQQQLLCLRRLALLVLLCPAAASESGALRAIKSSAGAAVALEFGAVQTQQAGDAAALRRKFAAAGGSSAGGAS